MKHQAVIRIAQWSVDLFLGIYPEEESSVQAVVFDLKLHGPWAAASNGDLSLTMDYSWLKDALVSFWQERKWGLMETLAEATVEFCFEHTHATSLTLEITKPAALAPAVVSYSLHRDRGSL